MPEKIQGKIHRGRARIVLNLSYVWDPYSPTGGEATLEIFRLGSGRRKDVLGTCGSPTTRR